MWEDPSNVAGGRWVVIVISNFYVSFLMISLGGQNEATTKIGPLLARSDDGRHW